MTALINRQVRLRAHPVGIPDADTWSFTTEPVAEPAEGEFLAKILCIAMDPAMRVWLNKGDTYVSHVGLGDVMRASVVATVVASKHPDFAPGDYVAGRLGVQQYAISKGVDMIGHAVVKIPKGTVAPSAYLGVLGIPGLTAYFWSARGRSPASGADGRGVRRNRCGRQCRWTDRPNQGLPCGRHRRRPRQMRLPQGCPWLRWRC